MDSKRIQKRKQIQAKANESGYYYFIYDLDEFNGEGGLDLSPVPIIIPLGQEFYQILLLEYPNIISGYPRTFSLKNKLFVEKDFSLNILVIAHTNCIINLGYENDAVHFEVGLQKFYNRLITQNPKLWPRIYNVYEQGLANYIKQTKKIKNIKELNRNFILTNILYGDLVQLVTGSIKLNAKESLDFARMILKFACEIENFYQTTQAYPDGKMVGFNRENNLSDLYDLMFKPILPLIPNMLAAAKKNFDSQEYTSAQEWYEIAARLEIDLKKKQTFKMLANLSKTKADEAKANAKPLVVEPVQLISTTPEEKIGSDKNEVCVVTDKLDQSSLEESSPVDGQDISKKKKKVKKLNTISESADVDSMPNLEEIPQVLMETKSISCDQVNEPVQNQNEFNFNELMFDEAKEIVVKSYQVEINKARMRGLSDEYKANYQRFFSFTRSTTIMQAVANDIKDEQDPYLHRNEFSALGNVVLDDIAYSSTYSDRDPDIFYFDETSAEPLVQKLLNHVWKDQVNVDVVVDTIKRKFDAAGGQAVFPPCMSVADVTYKGKRYAFVALSGVADQEQLREALATSIEEYNRIHCKESNFVEMVFLDGPVWNHSLMMNNIYRELYDSHDDLNFRKNCAEKILFSTCNKCFAEDPNFRIHAVVNVSFYPFKHQLNQRNQLIRDPYAKSPVNYRDRDIILKNGYYTTPIPCCKDCGKIKDSSLVSMMSAREEGQKRRAVDIKRSKSQVSFITSPLTDSIRTRTTILGNDVSIKQKR